MGGFIKENVYFKQLVDCKLNFETTEIVGKHSGPPFLLSETRASGGEGGQ